MKRAFEKTLPLKERERIRKEKMEAERAKKEEEKARKAAEKAKAEEVSLTSAFLPPSTIAVVLGKSEGNSFRWGNGSTGFGAGGVVN